MMGRRAWSCSLLLLLGVVSMGGCEAITLLIDSFAKKKEIRPPDIGMLIDPVDAHTLGFGLQWATDLGVPEDQTLAHIRVLGDVLVAVESPSNVVTVISMRDGSLRWRRVIGKLADKLYEPVRSGDLLLINSEQLLYAVSLDTGKTIEVTRLESLVSHAPAMVGDLAIFGGMNHRVFAHDIKAGYTKWAYQLTERVFARPAAFGPNVFVADGNGVYALFEADTGTLLWKGRTFDRVSAQPAMSRMGVFVAGEDHSLYALHAATGRDRWIYHSTEPLTLSPHVFGGTVILPEPGRGMVAIDVRTGDERWRKPFVAYPVSRSEGTLLVHTADSFRVLNLESGKTLTEVPVHPLKTVLKGPDGQMILVSPGGRLLLLDPQS